MDTREYAFNLSDEVKIERSEEKGHVVARAEYLRTFIPSYLVEYTAADGRATYDWFTEDQLVKV